MEATVRKIPLNKLVLSPANARKTPSSPAEDAELKANIRACGLKQNLVVHPVTDEKGLHAVTGGGRRLMKILQELAAEGVIATDHKVPCLVEDPEQALETSLIENTVRAGMHPADEFVAMAGLIDAGQPIEAVAARFGVSERHVKQRLRLGKVAPELLDEFRAGEISLEVMTAFTLGVDHDTQLAVWRQVRTQPYVTPHAVRRLLTQGAVSVDSRLGAFVDVAAYEAAGGTVRRDLFSTRDERFMDDAGPPACHREVGGQGSGVAVELSMGQADARPGLRLHCRVPVYPSETGPAAARNWRGAHVHRAPFDGTRRPCRG
jgi:ParB family chromosome partitioning protein